MKTRRTVLTGLATLPLTATLTTAEQTTYKPLLTVTSADGTTVEFITSSALNMNDEFCAANEPPYRDSSNLDNVWVRLVTPINEMKNSHNRHNAPYAFFGPHMLMGPFATLAEAFEEACDPFLNVVASEAFIRPENQVK